MRCERVDETNVWSLRRFNRTHTTIVGRVNVANLKTRALTGQTTRAKRRETTLVRDLGERVCLVHELRQLGRAEELTDRSHNRLRIDEIVRHDRIDINRRHTLLDGALHADQTNAVLVFHELTNRADTTVTEVIDIVDIAATVLQVEDRGHDSHNVFLAEDADIIRAIEVEAHVHFDPANGRQVIPLRIEEELVEQGFSRFLGRWLTRAHDTVNVGERFKTRLVLVSRKRVAEPWTTRRTVNIQKSKLFNACVTKFSNELFGQLFTRFSVDLTGFVVHDVVCTELAFERRARNENVLKATFGKLARLDGRQLLASLSCDFAGIRIDQIKARLRAAPCVRLERRGPASLVQAINGMRVERVEHVF